MRSLHLLVPLLLLALTAPASDLNVRVTDPQSAVVAGARVVLYAKGRAAAAAVRETSAEGVATFSGLASGEYGVQVLAAGFAPQSLSVTAPRDSLLTVRLSVASAAATVVVSAERMLLPSDESGAETASLDSAALTAMQPVEALDGPGGTVAFGVVPMFQVVRLELVRGAESTLYGSDAMTSVVEMCSRTGSTHVPERSEEHTS